MQVGGDPPHILQEIWEADPAKGPVWDAYHHDTLWTPQVGYFVYVVPSTPYDYGITIFIEMVLKMGWVDSPMFCALSKTLPNAPNALVDPDQPVPAYGTIVSHCTTCTTRSLETIDKQFAIECLCTLRSEL